MREIILRAQLDKCSRQMGYKSYEDYLQSEHWDKVRQHFLKYDCFCCFTTIGPFQLHHINYDNLGWESDEDLITVCVKCHNRIHKDKKLTKSKCGLKRHAELRRINYYKRLQKGLTKQD